MSGGAFNYLEYQLDYLGADIERCLEDIADPELYDHIKQLASEARGLATKVKKLDYYLSGDSSDYK